MDNGKQPVLHDIADRICDLLKGKIPGKLEDSDHDDEVVDRLVESVNQLIASFAEIRDFVVPLSQGELHRFAPTRTNVLASPLKELHARLLHLTWQTERIAEGDYQQRVDFMGDFSVAFNTMVARLAQREEALQQATSQLAQKVDERTAQLQATNQQLRQLNETLQETVEKLTAANRELEDVAYISAHDLSTPVRGIAMMAQWLVDDCRSQLDEKHLEFIDLLMERAHQTYALIDGLRQYCQLGRRTPQGQPVDLNTLVAQIVAELSVPANISIRIDGTLPVAVCDRRYTAVIFSGLLDNAVRHREEGPGHVTISATAEDGHWKLSVADDGPGIEAQYWDKIFRIFQTLRSRRDPAHVGAGLALVKKAVELQGGHIWVESHIGRGSTFYFTLPTKHGVACSHEQP
jgi:signal transduction histidine kinase